ncbi:acyltransferase [Actinotalea ferrariae]|uniref:acyltransferase family protein n=1 Tax=Actinotalea ferrariae TaxID=1386098 RepID=UPI001C8CCC84|nr:acyltransferase [Actinotalea ferrariae]MBX9243789.1 acyltransferase [Actinotalea ferrariae]
MVTIAALRARLPTGTAPRPAATPRLRTLDGLRFLAAAGVLLYHFTARWSTAWGVEPVERFPDVGKVTTYFALAPELFFVISGFVILWTAWGRTVPGVVASRLARLLPSYWTALLLTSVLLLVLWPDGKDITLGQVAVNATLLQEPLGVAHVDGVYWTLWTELRFYLLVVVLAAVGITRRRVLALAGLWPVVALLAELAGVEWLATLLVGRYAPLFAGGMLLYLLHRDGHDRGTWALLGLNVTLAVAAIVPAQVASLTRNTAYDPSPVLLGVLVVGCFAAVAALTLTRLQHWDVRAFTTVGCLTYPLYLVHEYWGWWTIHLLHDRLPAVLTLAAATAVSLALAWLVHHGVEKRVNPPMRRWIEARLSRPAAARPPARAAASRPGSPSRTPA